MTFKCLLDNKWICLDVYLTFSFHLETDLLMVILMETGAPGKVRICLIKLYQTLLPSLIRKHFITATPKIFRCLPLYFVPWDCLLQRPLFVWNMTLIFYMFSEPRLKSQSSSIRFSDESDHVQVGDKYIGVWKRDRDRRIGQQFCLSEN